MAIYNHPSWIYFNDTEFFELLSNLGHRELLKLARSRGLVFSEKSDESFVRSSLSLLPSNWPVVTQIYDTIAKPDPTERKSALHVKGCATNNDIVAMGNTLRDDRAQKFEETYSINNDGTQTTRISVSFTETDPTKALQYSRRKRTAEVEVVQVGDKISFYHDATDKARLLVKLLKKQIKPAVENENLKEEVISLKTVRVPALRTLFFTELLKGISGQSFVGASHVLVDCRLPSDNQSAGDADDKKAKKNAKAVKSIINKMSFSGELVLGAALYQQATDTGYFITQINWTTEDKKVPGSFVDYVAGFGEPINCDHFSSDVVKRWQWSTDDPDKPETLALSATERRQLNALVQTSADKAFGIVVQKAEANKTKKV